MSDDLAEKVAAVLHHEGWPADDGWTLTPDTCETCARSLRQAAALLPLIREREAAAWERALREAERRLVPSLNTCHDPHATAIRPPHRKRGRGVLLLGRWHESRECEASGGAYVRTFSGWACVR